MSRQLLLVGEDNPVSSAPQYALYPYPPNCAGARLCNMILGLSEDEYLALWRTNLCTPSWSQRQAGHRALELLSVDVPWTRLVLLGRKVAKVFEPITVAKSLEPFSISRIEINSRVFTIASLPHPSGRCREWNDVNNYGRARDVMKTLAPSIQWGAS